MNLRISTCVLLMVYILKCECKDKVVTEAVYNRMIATLKNVASNYRKAVGYVNDAMVDCGQLGQPLPPSNCQLPKPFEE
jgi:hypothetical protein